MNAIFQWITDRLNSLHSFFETVRNLGTGILVYFVGLGILAFAILLGPLTESIIRRHFRAILSLPKLVWRLPYLIYSQPILSCAVIINIIVITTFFYFKYNDTSQPNVLRGRQTESAKNVRRSLQARSSALQSKSKPETTRLGPPTRRRR